MTDGPAGYVVTVDPGDRIHFLDWGGSGGGTARGVLLIHGLSQTAWLWSPVARRLVGGSTDAAGAVSIPTVAMDLRGHGLSDAPTEDGAYDLAVMADDVIAVAEGSGLLDAASASIVLVGHGFGAMVAAEAAAQLGERCAGLVLVDGGWEVIETAVGMEADEFLRGLDEPPEVMRSLRAYLADRRSFDPATWDDDQDVAARATVVETHAGRVVPATRPHALEACVRAMFTYDPMATLVELPIPVTALIGTDDAAGSRTTALREVSAARVAAGRPAIAVHPVAAVGHNLMRYRPDEVTAAIRAIAAPATTPTA